MITVSQNEKGLRLNLDMIPYGIIVVRDGVIIKTNSYLNKLINRDAKDLENISFETIVSEKDRELVQSNPKENEELQIRLLNKGEHEVWCEVKTQIGIFENIECHFHYVNELSLQKINENLLNSLMKRMAQTGERRSFESMVLALTEVLGFHYAFIGMYDRKTNEITIRSMSIANELQEPFGYGISATPCGDVIRQGSLEVSEKAQAAYPEDHYLVDWQVDAYIGVALKDAKNETIGHLAVMDTKPIENSSFIQTLLSFFSYRLGIKMEHEIQEKELRRNEKRYKSLFNNSFEAKVIYNRTTKKFIEANDAAAKLFKHPKEKFKELGLNDIKPEKVFNGILSEQQVNNNLALLDAGQKVHKETLSKTSDGEILYTDVTLSIFGGDKNLIIVSYRDISEKKKVQRSLEISEKRFRSLFEHSFDAIFLMNLETNKYENCNSRAVELFKYSREDLLSMSPLDIVAGKQKDGVDPRTVVKQNIDSLVKNKKLRFEFHFMKSDGEIFEAEVSLLPIINEQKTFCITTIKDISEKKRQEANLRKRKEFLRKVIDLNPNLIFSKDKEGRFTVANKATGDFLGVDPDDLIGEPWQKFYSQSDEVDQILKSDNIVLNTKKSVDTSIEHITCCQGITRALQTSKMPIVNEHGQVEQVLNVATDISTHVNMERKLRDNNMELKKVNTELDHFVYRASHDLRAPLASILGFTNLTKNEKSIDEIKKYNLYIEKQIQKLDGFIKDIISYSRISRTDKEENLIDFDRIVADIFESLLFLGKSADIKKCFNALGDHAFYSDLQSVTFILKNLLSNAIKYSKSKDDNPYIKVEIAVDSKQAKIKVADNGIGIEPEYMPHIFDMFFRATEESDGSGLGLFIVKQSVDRLEGEIFVNSTINEGTEFVIILPNRQVSSIQN